MNNNDSGGNFFNGLLLGALIGGGVVFLLGTKKGKKLLKTITEEGLEGMSQFEDFVEDEGDAYEEEPVIVKSKQKEPSGVVETKDETNASSGGQIKRLFKGIHRK